MTPAVADLTKQHKYFDPSAGVNFVPVTIEDSGVWGKRPIELLTEIAHTVVEDSHDPRSKFLPLLIMKIKIEDAPL